MGTAGRLAHHMSLAGLLVPLAADKAVAEAVRAARAGDRPMLDLAAPSPLRPFLIAALAATGPDGAGRPVLVVTATGREAEDLADALACLLPPDSVAVFPAWETLPHERLSPARRTPSAAAWRCCAGSPTPTTPTRRRAGCRSSSPRSAPCCSRWSPGLGDLEPVALRAGDEIALDGRRRRARRRGVHPGRPGRAARRVRRPRRHPRRLPADRGAPGAGRVLGRHGRGGPLVHGRRPAQPRGRRARAVGAAVPRAAARPDAVRARAVGPGGRAPRSSPTCSTSSPRASPSRAWSRWRPSWSTTWSCCSTCCRPAPTSCSATPSGSAPGRTTWSRPARSSWRRPGPPRRPAARAPLDLGAAAFRRRSPRCAPTRVAVGVAVVDRSRRSAPDVETGPATRTPSWSQAPGRRGLPRRHRPGAGRRAGAGSAPAGGVVAGHRGPRPGRSACSSACAEADVAARLDVDARRRARARPSRTSPRRRSSTASSHDAARLVAAHRDRPGRPARRPPRTCAGCPAGGATSSTRCSCAPATTWCTSSTASAATSRWSSAPSQGATREYLVIEYAAVQARPARRPAVRPHRPARPGHPLRRRRGADAAPARRRATGPRPRAGPARRSREIAGRADPALQRPAGLAGLRLRPGHARGSASSRTPSRTSRRPTSSPRSTRSRPTWSSRSRWTG